jgi:hypothetical protein
MANGSITTTLANGIDVPKSATAPLLGDGTSKHKKRTAAQPLPDLI